MPLSKLPRRFGLGALNVCVILVGATVVLTDSIVAFGLLFMSPSHYSGLLWIKVLLACFLDLPALIMSAWKPRIGALVIFFGITSTFLYEIVFFSLANQLPLKPVILQDTCFLGTKLILVGLILMSAHKAEMVT